MNKACNDNVFVRAEVSFQLEDQLPGPAQVPTLRYLVQAQVEQGAGRLPLQRLPAAHRLDQTPQHPGERSHVLVESQLAVSNVQAGELLLREDRRQDHSRVFRFRGEIILGETIFIFTTCLKRSFLGTKKLG